MGNSEVGHLNLGAGAIVPQDLARIDAAVRDGTLGENETLQAALRGAERVHLIGLVSSGGVHSSEEHLKALIGLAADWNVPGPRDPRVHRRTRHVADVRRRLGREGRGRVPRARDRAGRLGRSAATTRWTATSARSGRRRPSTCSARARAEHHADDRRGGGARRLRARRDRRVHHRDDGRRGRPDPARRLGARVQLPPRPDAPDHDEAVRGRRLVHDADAVRRGLDVPGRVPAAPADGHDRQGDRGRRSRPAARRRDGEVPARDVLLQRRRGGAVRRRGARARAVAARRADLRPQAGDERARGDRGVPAPLGASRTSRSRSSTSRTPTWSATRA